LNIVFLDEHERM